MLEDPPVAEMVDIVASTLPVLDRAQSLVESLGRWLSVDAVWLTLCDPASNAYATVGSTGLERPVLDYLASPSVAQEVQLAALNHDRPPVSVTELPVPVDELPTWADCLIPTGFRGGLGVPLCEPGGLSVGMLSLLAASDEPPSSAVRHHLGQLAPLIARGVSPIRSVGATTALMHGATSGAVLVSDGTTYPVPGLQDHPLLHRHSEVVDIARRMISAGQEYRTFMWPGDDEAGTAGHARVTVLAANGVPRFLTGMLLVTPQASCRGLTRRELEVLGLVVEGRSNQQIAHRLGLALRTVATHLEHILRKLEVPSRTLAAVRAEREGCHVPPRPDS
ncbi:LuxR C-terminal-related transcriptional regulator [Aeromicrobium sp. IC_218]|uniref:helix-turn-helix transcriptional regulator n=1 Tax=Aeromicrobium sp. IC_218 TaxID=2545468 RepID=UPI00103FE354|nr:LuxR C-terminal-related transcriptional regulator [Aeromicrobium sp. IC_218]TCI99692.1 response regulator transcription factor [Aeromicrobium sp. IC_218]